MAKSERNRQNESKNGEERRRKKDKRVGRQKKRGVLGCELHFISFVLLSGATRPRG